MIHDPRVLFLKAANTSLCRAKEPLGFNRTLKLPNNNKDLTSKFKRFFTECVKESSDNVSNIDSGFDFSNLRFLYSFKKNKKVKLLTPRRLTDEELSAFYACLLVLSPHKFLKIHLSWVLNTEHPPFLADPENMETRSILSEKFVHRAFSSGELILHVSDLEILAPRIAKTVLVRYPFLRLKEDFIVDAIKMGFVNYTYLAKTSRSWSIYSEIEDNHFCTVIHLNFLPYGIFSPPSLRVIENIYPLASNEDQKTKVEEGWAIQRQKIVTFTEGNHNNLNISFNGNHREDLAENYIGACTANYGYKTTSSIDIPHIKRLFDSFLRAKAFNRSLANDIEYIEEYAIKAGVNLKTYTACQYIVFRDMLRTFKLIEQDEALFIDEAFAFRNDRHRFTDNDVLMNIFSYFFKAGFNGPLSMDYFDVLFSSENSMKFVGCTSDVNITNQTYIDVHSHVDFSHILSPKKFFDFISNVMKTDNPDFVIPDFDASVAPAESEQNDNN